MALQVIFYWNRNTILTVSQAIYFIVFVFHCFMHRDIRNNLLRNLRSDLEPFFREITEM